MKRGDRVRDITDGEEGVIYFLGGRHSKVCSVRFDTKGLYANVPLRNLIVLSTQPTLDEDQNE